MEVPIELYKSAFYLTIMLRKHAARTPRTPSVAESFRAGAPRNLDAISGWEKILVLACTYSPRGVRGGETRAVELTPVLQDDFQ
jgi:hypothetical protein